LAALNGKFVPRGIAIKGICHPELSSQFNSLHKKNEQSWYYLHMQSELVKQLKDAGFPQEKKQSIFIVHPSAYSEDGKTVNMMTATLEGGSAYAPTLEELIEACGKLHRASRATFRLEYNFDSKWKAGYAFDDYWPLSDFGETTIEAVARLWLALNAKTL
jgi:hypothetical protein